MDIQAAKKRCEAATDLTMWAITAREDGFCVGNGRGHNVAPHIRNQTDAEFFAHARADLLAALEALEEAQALLQRWRYAEGGAEQEKLFEETMVALGESK